MTRNYAVTRYQDGQVIGHVELTDEQFNHYLTMVQQPQCIIHLGALPHDYYNLDSEYQDTSPDTVVFLGD